KTYKIKPRIKKKKVRSKLSKLREKKKRRKRKHCEAGGRAGNRRPRSWPPRSR
ncbi:unnamed protein product, partial [Ixodes persulcatus]